MTATSPTPRTRAEVLARYTELRDLHQQRLNMFSRRHQVGLFGITAALGLVAVQAFRALHGSSIPWLLATGVVATALLVWYLLRQQHRLTREFRLLTLYERNLHRADGSQVQSGQTGTETGKDLRTPGHLYERDLDLFGPNSLFGLLATVRTGPGERGVARYLAEPASHDETLRRQQAVKELLPQLPLREKIALLGESSFQQVSASFFDEWLDDTPPHFTPAYRIALIATACLNVSLILAGFTHLLTWSTVFPNLALVLCLHGAIAFKLRARVLPLLNGSARLQRSIRLITEGLTLMQSTPFDCPKLKQLQQAALQPAGAVKLLERLEGHLTIVEQRSKEWYLVLSLLLAAGTQAAMSIAAWKHEHGAEMRGWLATWAEFEALAALATYAFEHPTEDGTYAWPDLLAPGHPPLYEAVSLAHPLLPNAVPNDISLGPGTRFYLISGSNMSGKSTLLRTVGINAVLAYAGAPVHAQSMRLTPLVIGASLSLTDSLSEGRSKFLAEVQRLSAIIEAGAASPVLFLVDEIFSGTNSEDRRAAANAVLQKLLANGAIGALSTHDLALTSLVTPSNSGLNVHMASPSPDDPLAFDYKLKSGVNTSSSAAAILRLIGLPT